MAKRRNENGQMRREEYEAQDSRDDDGITADSFSVGFERASESSIRQRKIVKARVGQRMAAKPAIAAAAGGAGSGSAAPAASANPFGGFSGLTASQATAASANPFAGFSGLTGASPAAPTPSFAPAPAPAASTPVPAAFSTNGAPKASASSYQEAMEVLNKEFMTFVNSQAKESPSSSWIAAAQEYVTYANEIAKKHAATKPVPLEQQGKKSAAPAPFSFAPSMTSASPASAVTPKSPKESGFFSASKVSTPTKPKESMVPSFTSSASAPSFSFGAAKKDSTPSKETKSKEAEVTKSPSRFGGFSFGATSSSSTEETKTIPAFSFGAKPVFPPATSTTPSTSSSGFSFGNFSSSSTTPTSLPPASKPFSFGASAAGSSSTTASSGAGAPANDEEDEEQVGREEATVILKSDSNEEDDCTFDVDKAKVLEFKKDEKRWADKGVHPLKVLVNKETKAGRILVRNEIGKIVLNAALYKGITLKPHETKGKTTGVLLSLQADADAGLTQFIIKVNAAKVDDLISSLDKAANGGSS